jgi:sulfite oxidase
VAIPTGTLSRRDCLRLAARACIGASATATLARDVFGARQDAVATGKHASMIARSARPVDFETPVALLDSFLTPPEAFFVRGHMLAPAVDPLAWSLAVDGDVRTARTLSLAELRTLPQVTVTATLECAGNGRAFFEPPVAGVQWRKGAVGTSRWTGVRLRDVMAAAGAAPGATHVWMTGADRPLGSQPPFVRQVPWAKAIDPDTIVAYEIEGRTLPLLHGAPLRVIVPGWEGAYSVKWLQRLTVASREHDGFWVTGAYRYPIRRVVPGATVDARDQAPLTGLSVKSLITSPLDGTVVSPGAVRIAGFAWAGESRVTRVEISTDGGASWMPARLTGEVHKYAWRRFEFDALLRQPEAYAVLSRATDDRGVTQPIIPRWNPAGYLWNAPDRIDIIAATSPATPRSPAPVSTAAADPARNATYETACRACHADDLAAQQRLTPEAWGRTVDKMVRWGAHVNADERGPLVEYLASRWGVR